MLPQLTRRDTPVAMPSQPWEDEVGVGAQGGAISSICLTTVQKPATFICAKDTLKPRHGGIHVR